MAGELERLARVGGGLTAPEVDATLRVLDRMQAAFDELLAGDDAPR